jgi:PIN domain nuclease of toxin-antitoxin system
MSTGWLLDTHALLWWMAGDAQLVAPIAKGIRDPQQDIHISAAVVWEIGIKHRVGKLSGVEDYRKRSAAFLPPHPPCSRAT